MQQGLSEKAAKTIFLKNKCKRLLLTLTLAYSILLLGACSLQNKMLYHPQVESLAQQQQVAKNYGLQSWPSNDDCQGFLARPSTSQVAGTIILCHGNAGHALHRINYLPNLLQRGWRVLLLEYPAFGHRPGELGEEVFAQVTLAAIDGINKQFPGERLILMGESLGCGVACSSIKQINSEQVHALVLITPWDNLCDLASEKLPLLPASWFLNDPYDSAANLKDYKGFILIAAAEHDRVIPLHHALALRKKTPQSQWLLMPDCGHNSWMTQQGELFFSHFDKLVKKLE